MTATTTLTNTKTSRLTRQFINDINTGQFTPGSPLPQQEDLAKKYQVSCPTLRKVLNVLASEGKLVKTPQGGIVVPAAKEEAAGNMATFEPVQTRVKPTIATVWAAEPDYLVTSLMEGIQKYTQSHHLLFRNYLSPKGHEATLKILENIDRYSVEGVLLMPYDTPEYAAVIHRLTERKFPFVAVRAFPKAHIPTVNSDDGVGAYMATHYLIEKYHRPVYYINDPKQEDLNVDRFIGYRNAMDEAGYGSLVEEHTCYMQDGSANPQYWEHDKKWVLGYEAAKRLLGRISFPASIFCLNDYGAWGMYKAAEERKLTVGQDIMIAGFDDNPVARILKPGLTTIRTPKVEHGFEAARLLHNIITNGYGEPVHIRMPVELVIRGSA